MNIQPNHCIDLPAEGSWPKAVHVFDEKSIWAIKAALTAERPLLVRGEPGTGKSQFARAAARVLNRVFISEVVHARTESRDLLWSFDAVARLGEAQTLGVGKVEKDVSARLAPQRFLGPGALWWTFDWDSAHDQFERCGLGIRPPKRPEGWEPAHGCVLLIDEIDKADADLPNGLLETLGNGSFTVPYLDDPVGMAGNAQPPLVVITTNEERELPAAFLRRCLVLHLRMPAEEEELKCWLCKRGYHHFKDECSRDVRLKAAELLWKDRDNALKYGLPAPGQAEYLDLLRAVKRLGKDEAGQIEALQAISEFALVKHPGELG